MGELPLPDPEPPTDEGRSSIATDDLSTFLAETIPSDDVSVLTEARRGMEDDRVGLNELLGFAYQ